jgi:hypothetical protein
MRSKGGAAGGDGAAPVESAAPKWPPVSATVICLACIHAANWTPDGPLAPPVAPSGKTVAPPLMRRSTDTNAEAIQIGKCTLHIEDRSRFITCLASGSAIIQQ